MQTLTTRIARLFWTQSASLSLSHHAVLDISRLHPKDCWRGFALDSISAAGYKLSEEFHSSSGSTTGITVMSSLSAAPRGTIL